MKYWGDWHEFIIDSLLGEVGTGSSPSCPVVITEEPASSSTRPEEGQDSSKCQPVDSYPQLWTLESCRWKKIKACLWNTDYAPGDNKVQKSYF